MTDKTKTNDERLAEAINLRSKIAKAQLQLYELSHHADDLGFGATSNILTIAADDTLQRAMNFMQQGIERLGGK